MTSPAHTSDHGQSTMAVALLVLGVTALVAAGLADLSRSELTVVRHRRTLALGLAAVDACLADVVSALPADWTFAASLRGADDIDGTSDDGVVPAPPGCTARLAPGPLGTSRPFVDVAAVGGGGARHVRAVLARVAEPVPAVLWIADVASLGGTATALGLDGSDALRPDIPAVAALVGPAEATELDAWLGTNGVVAGTGTRPAAFHPPPPLAEIATRLSGMGASTTFMPEGSPPAPALHAVMGDLAIVTPGFGAGLLYVDGLLDIAADFAFSGIVVARGGVRVSSGGSFDVDGSLWLGPAGFVVAGPTRIRYRRDALDAVDTLFPLPRRALVTGLLDT